MSFKSPIKDPNNFVSSEVLKQLISKERQISSFLFFSGEIEFPLYSDGYNINIHTNKYVIFEFWHCVKNNSFNVAEQAVGIHKRTHPQSIYHYQDEWPKYRDPYLRSALFYLLNRYSPTGTISHGEVRRDNFSLLSIETLKRFSQFSSDLTLRYYQDEYFLDGLDSVDKSDLILLPIGKYSYNLIGKQTQRGYETYHIEHDKIKQKLNELGNDFVLVYKKHPRLADEFKEFNKLYVSKFGKITNRLDLAEDVIITNLSV